MKNNITLFQQEYNLIQLLKDGPQKEQNNSNQFSKEDIKHYRNSIKEDFIFACEPQRYWGPYKIDKREFDSAVNEIISIYSKNNNEAGCVMMFERFPIRRPVIVYFSKLKEVTKHSGCLLFQQEEIKEYSNYNYLGVLHSHPEHSTRDGYVDTYDYPSVEDFVSTNAAVVGVVRPKKKKIIFYKIKAPYLIKDYFYTLLSDGLDKKRNLDSLEEKKNVDILCLTLIEKCCLKEEILI